MQRIWFHHFEICNVGFKKKKKKSRFKSALSVGTDPLIKKPIDSIGFVFDFSVKHIRIETCPNRFDRLTTTENP